MAHRILVPFELPDAEGLSPVLVEDLSSMEIVALGHFTLPEQTPPDAGRAQFHEEAQAELDDLVAPFRERGTAVTTRLVFGKVREKTIDRVALEEDCDAELDPAATERIETILVPLVDTENLDNVSDFVAALCEDTTNEITLFHVVEEDDDDDVPTIEAMLEGAREDMIAARHDPDLVDISVVEAEEHDDAILAKADDYDAVVMGEADPDIRDRIFGTLSDRIADRTGDPVIIVRRNL